MGQWLNSKVGKALKQYKRHWWVDRILYDITNPVVTIIRRMRIGNSDLNAHKSGHGRNRLCKYCDDDLPETINHYFLKCNKYINERRNLKNSIRRSLDHMKMKFTTRNLLGM